MENKYLILVNKENKMENLDDYEIIKCNSAYADDRYLERKTYDQFLKLKDYYMN